MSTTIQKINVIAYRIRHPKNLDPLTLIRTLEDLTVFPSNECVLETTRVDNVHSGNCTFVILKCEGRDEERAHVIYLQKNEGGRTKCIGNDPLTAWDSAATLTRIQD
jgi:hypothetical protein